MKPASEQYLAPDVSDSLRQQWETCDATFAHLTINRWLKDEEHLFRFWEKYFIPWFDFTGKTLVDYGCGGGYLGRLLLESYDLGQYVGLDIAQRSIDKAAEILKRHRRVVVLQRLPVALSQYHADILVCQACIQHFDRDTYEAFFPAVNMSGIPELMLQIRRGDQLLFNPGDLRLACRTTHEDVAARLPAYTLVQMRDGCDKTGYCFLHLQRRQEVP